MNVERALSDAMPQITEAAEKLGEAFGMLGWFAEAATREMTMLFWSIDWEAAIREEAVRAELTTEADIRRVYYDHGWWIQQHNWRRILVRPRT